MSDAPEAAAFSPGTLVQHDDGSYSVIFSAFPSSVELDRFYEKHGTEGGGYAWTSMVEHLVREQSPELLGALSFDPESSMFSAISRDLGALQAVARALGALQDVELVKKLVSSIDLSAYD